MSRKQKAVTAAAAGLALLATGCGSIPKAVAADNPRPAATASVECGTSLASTAEASPFFGDNAFFSALAKNAGRLAAYVKPNTKASASPDSGDVTGQFVLQNCDVVTVEVKNEGALQADSGSLSFIATETDKKGDTVQIVEASIAGSTDRLAINRASGIEDLYVKAPGYPDHLCETDGFKNNCALATGSDATKDGKVLMGEADTTLAYWLSDGHDGALPAPAQMTGLDTSSQAMPSDF